MDIQARRLSVEEQVEVEALYQLTEVPAWGAVVHMTFGDVVIFDGADGVRRYTLISGPDSPALAAQINQAAYSSPDAGLIAFLEDVTGRAVAAGESLFKLALFGGVVVLLALYSPQIKKALGAD